MALETSRAEMLQDRERNSIGSNGVSGGRKTGSGLHGASTCFSILQGEKMFRYELKDVNGYDLYFIECDK